MQQLQHASVSDHVAYIGAHLGRPPPPPGVRGVSHGPNMDAGDDVAPLQPSAVMDGGGGEGDDAAARAISEAAAAVAVGGGGDLPDVDPGELD